jgi:hypothetical protein
MMLEVKLPSWFFRDTHKVFCTDYIKSTYPLVSEPAFLRGFYATPHRGYPKKVVHSHVYLLGCNRLWKRFVYALAGLKWLMVTPFLIGYDLANQTAYLDDTLRWGLNWLIKA